MGGGNTELGTQMLGCGVTDEDWRRGEYLWDFGIGGGLTSLGGEGRAGKEGKGGERSTFESHLGDGRVGARVGRGLHVRVARTGMDLVLASRLPF